MNEQTQIILDNYINGNLSEVKLSLSKLSSLEAARTSVEIVGVLDERDATNFKRLLEKWS